MRPVQMRPRKASYSIIDTTIENSARSSTLGLGTDPTIVSSSAVMSSGRLSVGHARLDHPSRPEAKAVLYSSCSFVASRLHMRSNTSVSTSATRLHAPPSTAPPISAAPWGHAGGGDGTAYATVSMELRA